MVANDLNNTFSAGGEYELQCAIKLYGQPLLDTAIIYFVTILKPRCCTNDVY